MSAKEYLSEIRTLNTVISQKRQELDALQELASSIGSFDYSRDRVQISAKGEAPFTRTAERAAELDSEIRLLEDERLEHINRIQSLSDDRHITVLYMYYAGGMTLYKIADAMGYSYRQILRIRDEALDEFDKRCHIMSQRDEL